MLNETSTLIQQHKPGSETDGLGLNHRSSSCLLRDLGKVHRPLPVSQIWEL